VVLALGYNLLNAVQRSVCSDWDSVYEDIHTGSSSSTDFAP